MSTIEFRGQTIDQSIVRSMMLILIDLAMQQKRISYKELAERLGLPTHGNALGKCLSPYLDYVNYLCRSRGMPMLSVLVIRTSGNMQGYPGEGFYKLMQEWSVYEPLHNSDASRKLWTDAYTLKVFNYWSNGSLV